MKVKSKEDSGPWWAVVIGILIFVVLLYLSLHAHTNTGGVVTVTVYTTVYTTVTTIVHTTATVAGITFYVGREMKRDTESLAFLRFCPVKPSVGVALANASNNGTLYVGVDVHGMERSCSWLWLRPRKERTSPIAAMKHEKRPLYGVQFHPERYTPDNSVGSRVMGHFVKLMR